MNGRRHVLAAVPVALLAAMGVTAGLAMTAPASAAPAVAASAERTAPSLRPLVPPPPVPDRFGPEPPLPRAVAARAAAPRVVYTCEPHAAARMDDPTQPDVITNKDCPDLIAAKEQAQREYLAQLDSEVGTDPREYTCSDPTSADYGTAACGTDADGDGLMDDVVGFGG
ncbi:hypothetical protein WIS52_18945 [Pseudonocardia nematodicida]|uniref:Secreted protein n=1 Tax=Pseudonocardia nematodicida TaxID=1206997 RepID=A0ABV1KDL9_9PSEU